MKVALKLASKATGFTEPNPLVGAVVVKDHQVIASGYHRKYGADHAELDALKKVSANGTTLYVTLEPCIHFGKTPPCVDLVIEKKVQRVVVAMKDPNPLVNGKGIQKLKESGIAVTVDGGVSGDIARKMNRHYIKYITQKMPYVTLKAGVSLDGKLTDKYRKSQWVTSEELRIFSHTLRGEFSAIMAGTKTVTDDDPQLNIREKAWSDKRLYRIILDTHNTLDTRLKIFKDQNQFPLILFSSKETENRIPKVKNHFFVTPDNRNGLNLREVLGLLYQQKVASIMVEGGGRLFNTFLQEELYDEIVLYQAGTFIGGKKSVQLFTDGTSVSTPIELKEREVITFDTGCIIRGFR